MKTLYLTLLLLCPLIVCGQQIITASSEPLDLYHDINNALATDHPRDAIQTFRKVISFYEGNGREMDLPESYFGMALALALNGHYKESIRFHKKAIRCHRKYRGTEPTEILINLGLTYLLAGKDHKARRFLGDGPVNL
jgi:tetratricopeptide (TPR) repeat protein